MKWVEPSPAQPPSASDSLTHDQVQSWRERGFALVSGLLPNELIERALADALDVYPPPGSPGSEGVSDFGSHGRLEFPAESEAVNAVTLHPRLLRAVAQLLGVELRELRLTQSDLWPKYGRASAPASPYDNADQRMHMDYPNHTLLHPPAWDQPEAVELILYLCDVETCGGATALVPRTGREDPAYTWPLVNTPGVAGLPWINDRESAEARLRTLAPELARWREEELYPREVRARYRIGTILFYRHDTWHRGTPLEAGVLRLVHNMTFRRFASEWVSVLQPGWAWAMYRPSQVMERLIASASVEQRCVLGFPAPGHPYWTRQTLAAVGARYGPLGLDLAPYEAAI